MPASAPAFLLPIRAAIVDLDGTMVDTLGDFVHALSSMLADLELAPVDADTVAHYVGKGSEHLIRSVLALQLADPSAVDAHYPAAWEHYQQHYRRINGQFAAVYPGVQRGLDAMRASGWPMACVTNKPTEFAVQLLRTTGLLASFAHVFGGDAFERKKPDPLPLLRACEALGTLPQHTLMVGDSSNDVQAARAAGCPVVLVATGYNHGVPITEAGADMCLADLAELAAILSVAPRAF